MAKKSKVSQTSTNGVNKHILARALYLYEAAKYLQQQKLHGPKKDGDGPASTGLKKNAGLDATTLEFRKSQELTGRPFLGKPSCLGEQRRLVSHQKGVCMKGKGQARLPVDLKRSICKRCETILEEPSTCSTIVENESRGGAKPWADVRVVQCLCCGTEKRFPIGSRRQLRKGKRGSKPNPDDGSDKNQIAADMPADRNGNDVLFQDL